jgi:voltage-gated potassium channel
MLKMAGRRYRVLLFSLIGLILLTPLGGAGPNARIAFDLLGTCVFLLALWTVFATRRHRFYAILLGFPTLVGLWFGYLIPGVPRVPVALAFHGIGACFYGISIVAVLRSLYRERSTTADSLYGAFCGYLMVGLVFGNIYSLVELVQPGSFFGDAFKERGTEDHHFLFCYFSFLTLTTVGYGDIVPTRDFARSLAAVEAICGQFYIAVLVAELIGRRGGQQFPSPTLSGSP